LSFPVPRKTIARRCSRHFQISIRSPSNWDVAFQMQMAPDVMEAARDSPLDISARELPGKIMVLQQAQCGDDIISVHACLGFKGHRCGIVLPPACSVTWAYSQTRTQTSWRPCATCWKTAPSICPTRYVEEDVLNSVCLALAESRAALTGPPWHRAIGDTCERCVDTYEEHHLARSPIAQSATFNPRPSLLHQATNNNRRFRHK